MMKFVLFTTEVGKKNMKFQPLEYLKYFYLVVYFMQCVKVNLVVILLCRLVIHTGICRRT